MQGATISSSTEAKQYRQEAGNEGQARLRWWISDLGRVVFLQLARGAAILSINSRAELLLERGFPFITPV
jgi:hypothetical protein